MYNLLAMAAVVAGVFVIGSLVKNQIDIQQERKQFLAAQKEVNTLGNKIAKATNPDKHEAVAYCDYGHVKFGRGGRTCWTKYYQLNQNVSKDEALKLMSKVENEMTNLIEYEVRDARNLTSLKSLRFKSNDIGCGTALYYKEVGGLGYSDGNLEWEVPDRSSIIVTSCSGEAKAEHFPVKE